MESLDQFLKNIDTV